MMSISDQANLKRLASPPGPDGLLEAGRGSGVSPSPITILMDLFHQYGDIVYCRTRYNSFYLINDPALVLGDEPTGEVDSETSMQLLDLMRRINSERGVTFVIVTHDLEVAGRADRIIRLKDGRIASDEPITASGS